jgi:hypothetical protein
MNKLNRIWLVAAVVGIVTAAICFWFHYKDAAFVAVVLGCVAWILDFRARLKKPETD